MASSEDDNNNNNNDSEMGFQYRGEMSSGSMFNNKSSSGSGNNLFGSGWDPLENFGGSSSMVAVPHNTDLPYPEVGGLIHHYQSGSAIAADLIPKVASFGSGSFSEMVNPYLNPECGGSSSPNSRDKRKALHPQFNPIKNGKREERNDGSGDEKKQRIEANWKGKQMGKQAKENSNDSGKDNYIHVRAKRGQATNSHSLAERVRRERISERMKLLQELVPGCNKITGKAVMLDEIINYVQSLQQQVEFLSMKLATVNPELNIDIERLVFKDMVHSHSHSHSRGSSSNPGFGYSSSHSYPHGSLSLTGIPTTNAPLHPIHPQPVWDNDLHNLLQMGFDANLGQNGGGGGGAKMDV